MEQDLVHTVLSNVRHPLNYKVRIKFTTRAIMFLVNLLAGKSIDVIDLHTLILRMAHSIGCLDDPDEHITMTGAVVYLMINGGDIVTHEDLRSMMDILDVQRDNGHKEVLDTITLLSGLK